MKLCIFVSKTKTDITAQGLKVLYQSSGLTVQGDEDVQFFDLGDGRKAFITGDVLGYRTNQGDIIPLSQNFYDLKNILVHYSIEDSRNILEGRYILVIAGPDDQCSVSADHYGQRDIYYNTSGDVRCFASDLSLMPDSPAANGYDQAALVHALCMYGYRPPKRHTPYKEIRRLGVLDTVYIKNGTVQIKTEDFQPVRIENFSERELEEYADIFLEATKIRGSKYGNVVYLSSGWDSSSILASLVHVFGRRKVRAVIGRMKYAERSGVGNPFEISRAKAVAEYFNVPLAVVDFDYRGKKALEWHDRLHPAIQLPHHTSGGAGFNHAVLADYVAQTTNGEEAVFAGEISDGAHNLGFSQFMTIFHPVPEFREYSDKMGSYLFGPTFFNLFQENKYQEDLIYNLFLSRSGKSIFDARDKNSVHKRAIQFLSAFFLRPVRLPLWSMKNITFLTETGAKLYTGDMEDTYFKKAVRGITSDTLYSWYLHFYNSFHWQCSTIVPLNLTAELSGLKMAIPFWDTRLQEYLSAMPENWGRGLDLNPTKYPLKWMLKNRINYPLHLATGPHSYLYDVDPNFNLGAEMIYGSGFVPRFKEALKTGAYREVLSPDVFNIPHIEAIVGRYLKGTEVRGSELRELLSLCWLSLAGWYKK